MRNIGSFVSKLTKPFFFRNWYHLRAIVRQSEIFRQILRQPIGTQCIIFILFLGEISVPLYAMTSIYGTDLLSIASFRERNSKFLEIILPKPSNIKNKNLSIQPRLAPLQRFPVQFQIWISRQNHLWSTSLEGNISWKIWERHSLNKGMSMYFHLKLIIIYW